MTLSPPGAAAHESTWYKDAIIYEIRTRSFFDSNNDGVGDLPGLTSKLDYLQDLGITAIWLLPLCPSPGRDDGYDIANYTDIHPDVGTLADFEHMLREAHRRGIRVITELVLNHTSDQHPWFQRARRAPPGSVERNFYVWAESPERYPEARIIFKDFEVSNWSWDRVANAYYWHRFYAHQPDLNFENPAVQEALFEVVDFWFGLGVDGLRLDAVPYLYEEEGTNCENLPQTHAFLRKLRAHVDSKFENRMLLAEANQWPEDAAAYFGQGDECHMNFHFPLMPRMFMAIHQEDRFPVIDIFAQTPEVHPTCQWALFLRNHDELTLEMVTYEERDYMYRAYADQTAMRINLGIRRRLAPLVGNSRRKMELLSGLLFSLPGTPVVYYGDEIGMGDNVYLGDRNGVRTPMQWTMDRNAGFSRANPQRLILPVIIDPEYHYESLNVENQQQNPTSLLWWTKRLIALRKRFAAFGRGSIEFLGPTNPRILAFIREYHGNTVLVVANLSRFTQFAELDLTKHKGLVPLELFGKTRFPSIGDSATMITLGPHDFYWFSLERPRLQEEKPSLAPSAPPLECTNLQSLFLGSERALLDDVLPAFLEGRPWFAGRNRMLRAAHVVDVVPLSLGAGWLVFARAEYADGTSDLCLLPVLWEPSDRARAPSADRAIVAQVHCADTKSDSSRGAIVDAIDDPACLRAIFDAMVRKERLLGSRAELIASTVDEIQTSEADRTFEPRRLGPERGHVTIRMSERWVLKIFRRMSEGVSPELEICRFLMKHTSTVAPRLSGAMELVRPAAEPITVALLQGFVPHESSAWQFTLQNLGRYYDRVLARPAGEPGPAPPRESPFLLVGQEPPAVVAEMVGNYRDIASQLGVRVAELHLALASDKTDSDFAPEPYSAMDLRSKYQSLRNLSGRVLRRLRERMHALPAPAQREAASLLGREADIVKSFEPLRRAKGNALRIRVHGNLDLRHAIYTGKDFVLTDFDGPETLTLAERRRKRSPLRDLAWMVRSFEFAAYRMLLDPATVRESDVDAARPWAQHWTSWVAASFVQAYLNATAGAPFVPPEPRSTAGVFDAFLLEAALYQLQTELEDRPESTMIFLLAISNTLDRGH